MHRFTGMHEVGARQRVNKQLRDELDDYSD